VSHAPGSYPVSLLDYELPRELIAQQPLAERDASRLLAVSRAQATIMHRSFRELPELLPSESFLVLNDSRVMRCRYICTRKASGGRAEVLLTRVFADATAECLTEARGHLQPGERLAFRDGVEFEVLRPTGSEEPGLVRILLGNARPADRELREILTSGELPLPPYLREELADPERYQTSFAEPLGSSAAPTAGLHFSERTFADLARRGIEHTCITLHIGSATFLPIRGLEAARHRLAPEPYFIFPALFQRILAAKLAGRPIVAVGTTVIRALEWVFRDWRAVCRELGLFTPEEVAALPLRSLAGRFPLSGETALYILPGYRFRFVDALITNFHLPRTTLLALVYAFGGRDLIRRAYSEAVALRYRFYSLGDSMLIQ